jgi:hypothetical protein
MHGIPDSSPNPINIGRIYKQQPLAGLRLVFVSFGTIRLALGPDPIVFSDLRGLTHIVSVYPTLHTIIFGGSANLNDP